MIKEMENNAKTWSEAEKIAKNRVRWRAMVKALCLTRGKESQVKYVKYPSSMKGHDRFVCTALMGYCSLQGLFLVFLFMDNWYFASSTKKLK